MINPKAAIPADSSKSMNTTKKKLSANKMAEYLDARPARRASIVKQQQSESGHPAHYYSLAQAAMRRILASPDPSGQYTKELEHTSEHPGWGAHPLQLIENNCLALRGMWQAVVADSELLSSGLTYRSPTVLVDPRDFGDVRLTNKFDVESVITKRKPRYGGIKLYLNKKHPLSSFSADVLGALLYEASVVAYGRTSVEKGCIIIIDAFQSRTFHAPAKIKPPGVSPHISPFPPVEVE